MITKNFWTSTSLLLLAAFPLLPASAMAKDACEEYVSKELTRLGLGTFDKPTQGKVKLGDLKSEYEAFLDGHFKRMREIEKQAYKWPEKPKLRRDYFQLTSDIGETDPKKREEFIKKHKAAWDQYDKDAQVARETRKNGHRGLEGTPAGKELDLLYHKKHEKSQVLERIHTQLTYLGAHYDHTIQFGKAGKPFVRVFMKGETMVGFDSWGSDGEKLFHFAPRACTLNAVTKFSRDGSVYVTPKICSDLVLADKRLKPKKDQLTLNSPETAESIQLCQLHASEFTPAPTSDAPVPKVTPPPPKEMNSSGSTP